MGNDLFSASTIHTLSGASLAVLLIVQLIKDWPVLRNIPTKLLAVFIGETVLLLTTAPLPTSFIGWVILLLNGLVVASAAIGGWHLTNARRG